MGQADVDPGAGSGLDNTLNKQQNQETCLLCL